MQKENNPILELKINNPEYNQQNNQQNNQQIPNSQFYNPYVPVYNVYNSMYPYNYLPYMPPIVKKYNLTLDPQKDIAQLVNIYQDILPSDNNMQNYTFNTLKERDIIHRYIRSVFVKSNDGEQLLINDQQNKSKQEIINLLSHLKLLEPNPYGKKNDNKLKTMAKNFVIYTSCYPIKVNQQYNTISCALSSVGIHVRLYKETAFDETVKYTPERNTSDLWLELDYYKTVSENIIKQKKSPNFVALHYWYYTNNTGIDFNKYYGLRTIHTKNLKNEEYYTIHSDLCTLNYYYNIFKLNKTLTPPTRLLLYNDFKDDFETKFPSLSFRIIPTITTTTTTTTTTIPNMIFDIDNTVLECIKNDDTKKIILKNIKSSKEFIIKTVNTLYNNTILDDSKFKSTKNVLILLTEAPTQNIIEWASKMYSKENNVINTMVKTGFHDDTVWQSILFQILIAIITLSNEDQMFNELSLNNNVHIKDLKTNDQNIGVWKYICNNIDFFVPNFGYLVLLDSNYADLEYDYSEEKIHYKIKKKGNNYYTIEFYNTTFLNIRKIFYDLINNDTIIKPSDDFIRNINLFITILDNIINYFNNNNNSSIAGPSYNFTQLYDNIYILLNTIFPGVTLNPYYPDQTGIQTLLIETCIEILKKILLLLPLYFCSIFKYEYLHNRIGVNKSEQDDKYITNREIVKGSVCIINKEKFCLVVEKNANDLLIISKTSDTSTDNYEIVEVTVDDLEACSVQQLYKDGKELRVMETYVVY